MSGSIFSSGAEGEGEPSSEGEPADDSLFSEGPGDNPSAEDLSRPSSEPEGEEEKGAAAEGEFFASEAASVGEGGKGSPGGDGDPSQEGQTEFAPPEEPAGTEQEESSPGGDDPLFGEDAFVAGEEEPLEESLEEPVGEAPQASEVGAEGEPAEVAAGPGDPEGPEEEGLGPASAEMPKEKEAEELPGSEEPFGAGEEEQEAPASSLPEEEEATGKTAESEAQPGAPATTGSSTSGGGFLGGVFSRGSGERVLGVMVGADTLTGALTRAGEDGNADGSSTVFMTKPRGLEKEEGPSEEELYGESGFESREKETREDNDFGAAMEEDTFSGAGGDPFVGDIEMDVEEEFESFAEEESGSLSYAPSFADAFEEMLAEAASYTESAEGPSKVAFCAEAGVSRQKVVDVGSENVGRDDINDLLREELELQSDQGYEESDPALFIPMTGENGEYETGRFLGLMYPPIGSVLSTIREMKQGGGYIPSQGLLETETSLFYSLAAENEEEGEDRDPDDRHTSTLIRVGAENTLVLFVEGRKLRHVEMTGTFSAGNDLGLISSRLLFLQDEYGAASPDSIYVGIRDKKHDRWSRGELLDLVKESFPKATVSSISALLAGERGAFAEDEGEGSGAFPEEKEVEEGGGARASGAEDEDVRGDQLIAQTVAERYMPEARATRKAGRLMPGFAAGQGVMIDKDAFKEPWDFEEIWRKGRLGIFALAIFLVAFFFGLRYLSQEREKQDLEYQIERINENMPATEEGAVGGAMSEEAVQNEIDQMRQAQQQFMEGMSSLDSLLMGNDRYSHALAKMSSAVDRQEGLWIDVLQMSQGQENALSLEGVARERAQVTQFAGDIGGTIGQLTFDEIRGQPVYRFSMTFPMREELPSATKFLRTRATDSLRASAPSEASASGATASEATGRQAGGSAPAAGGAGAAGEASN